MVDFRAMSRQHDAETAVLGQFRTGDLFRWLDALWNKQRLDGTPPLRVMHRFLASDPDYAMAARVLLKEVREPALVVHVWQGLLPHAKGAPRLQYVGAKRAPDAEALTLRMMHVLGERRDVVETMIAMLEASGKSDELYSYYGVEREGIRT